jgi:cyanophycinase
MTGRGALVREVPMSRVVVVALLALPAPAWAQQVADSAFHFPVPRAAYAPGQGPLLVVDEAHANFHTVDGRYRPFAELARRDGYVVRAGTEPFSAASLEGVQVLVIANAMEEGAEWAVPVASAFTDDEIEAVVAWVRGGGGLLLLADHMPFPGAADALGRALGLRFVNGFAELPDDVFRRSDGTLADHPITRGRDRSERVDSVRTFTGQAFVAAAPGPHPLLVLDSGAVSLLPDTAWVFHDDTPSLDAQGAWQGAAFPLGAGRVVALGEAAMFSAQLAGAARRPMGMNHPQAAQNPQLLLNTLHWLSGLLPEAAPTVGPRSGSVMAVGGALTDTTIVRRFIELAGGPDAPIVVIPTAGGADTYDDDFGPAERFRENGATDVRVLHTWDRAQADSEAFVEPLRAAGGVWVSGGRQWRLADVYLGTRTEVELTRVLERGGVVGGSSAGATILGSYLVRGDTETNEIMMGDHEEGLGLLRGVGIDQHLLRRNRQFDLFEVIDAHPGLLGIGLDENTALVVQGDWGQVVGASYVVIYDPARRQGRVPFYLLGPSDAIHLGMRMPYVPTGRGLWPLVLR